MTRDAALAAQAAPSLPRRFVAAIETHRAFRDAFEIGLVVIAFLLYFIVRGLVVDRHDEALANAQTIMDWERALGIFWEPRLQEWVLDKRWLIEINNFIYFWLDFPLIAIVGIWMYFYRRHEYTVARDAILLSGAIALVIYNLYPVMPPRLLPTGEFVGTIEKYSDLSYQAQSTQAFVNPYAAVPSLHFGWAMILGGAVVLSTKNPLVRAIGLSLPWLQLASIVFTGNHYILDAFAGLVVCLAGVWLALAMQRWGYPAIKREVERRWGPTNTPAEAGTTPALSE
ncbi:MAG: phosphatase PAP2 family protein [Dehalococcoidia bacterium]